MKIAISTPRRDTVRILGQCAILLAPFAFFLDVSVAVRGWIDLPFAIGLLFLILINGAFGVCAASFLFLSLQKKDPERTAFRVRAGLFIKRHFGFILVSLLFTVLALDQFKDIPIYDAGQYYSGLISASQTFRYGTLLSSFTILTHPMQGPCLLLVPWELLFPGQAIGLYICLLLLNLSAGTALYSLLCRAFPRIRPLIVGLSLGAFFFSPFILGIFSYFNSDSVLLLLFLLLVWAFSQKYDLLVGFLLFLVCFSKEIGILYALGFLIPAVLLRARSGEEAKPFFRRLLSYLFPVRGPLFALPPLLFTVYYLFGNASHFMQNISGKSPLRWDSAGYDCFGINISHILIRSLQTFGYNGAILFVLLGTTALIRYFSNSKGRSRIKEYLCAKEREDSAARPALVGFIVAEVVLFLFACLFITNLCPRYTVTFVPVGTLILLVSVCLLFRRTIARIAAISLIILLLLTQSYTNIDPLIRTLGYPLDTGGSTIVSPTASWYSKEFLLDASGDMYVYNRAYAYVNDLNTRSLRVIPLSAEDTLVFWGMDWYELYLVGDPFQTDHMIGWDPSQETRTYAIDREGVFVPHYRILPTRFMEVTEPIDLPDTFYLCLPGRRGDDYVEPFLRRGYSVAQTIVIADSYGSIRIIKFTL